MLRVLENEIFNLKLLISMQGWDGAGIPEPIWGDFQI